jgi:hypothetical protein
MAQVEVLDFCTVSFHTKYMLVVMYEGVTVTQPLHDVLVEKAKSYYKDASFIYLTHRINSYAVDTSVYSKTSQLENLKGFGVITKNYKAKSNAEIEKLFLKKPFKIFEEIQQAVNWANSLF